MQLIVKLTNFCNLRCSYCSEGECATPRFINKQILLKLIDYVDDLLAFKKDQDIDFLWHGGEPLAYPKKDLIEVMDYAIQRLSSKYKVKFLMQTNLTLLDEQWITIIKRFKIGVGVSLDGYQELHDINRKTADNRPTFHLVYDNIEKLKENDIIPGILMVLNTSQKIDIDKLFDVIKKLKVPCKIHPVIPCGRAKNRTDIQQVSSNYVKLMKKIFIRMFEEERPLPIEPLDNLMDAILEKRTVRECSFAGNCGQSFMCVFSDGGVGFCGRKSDDFNLGYGSLNESTLLELYNSSNAVRIRNRQKYLQEHDCKYCDIFGLCHGGCSFEAAVSNGVPEAKFSNCKFRKELVGFLKTDGLRILKKYLISEKRRHLELLSEKKKLLKELAVREKQ